MEDSRAHYLINLIKLSYDEAYYRNIILSALGSHSENDYHLPQVFELAAYFSRCGDDEMKRTMYASFGHNCGFDHAGLVGAQALVELDGLNGLLFVAKHLANVDDDDRPYYFKQLLATLEVRDGKQPLPMELDALVQELEADEGRLAALRARIPEPPPTYETLKRNLTSANSIKWVRQASSAELEIAASDLIQQTDTKRLVTYLRMFRNVPFPAPIDFIINLARDPRDEVARAALGVLKNNTNPQIRELGLEFLDLPKWRGFATTLLINNPKEGDPQLLRRVIEITNDAEILHNLGIDVRKFTEANGSTDAAPVLLLLYEKGFCTICRKNVVEQLIRINRFPQRMREECMYDTDSETRKLCS